MRHAWIIPTVLIACVIQVIYFAKHPEATSIDGVESYAVARSIAQHGAFADPWALVRTGPTACLAPGYPFLMSFPERWCAGDVRCRLFSSVAISILGWAACLVALPFLSERLFGTAAPGFIAIAIGLLPIYPIAAGSEVQVAAALLAWGSLFALWLPASIVGVVIGVTALIHAAAPAALVPFTVLIRRWRVRDTAVLIAAFALAISPWIIRNRVAMGEWFYLRNNLGLELYTANRDVTELTQAGGIDAGEKWPHPNQNPQEANTLLQMGEMAYMRSRGRLALAWISTHPQKFARLTAQRVALWFIPLRGDLVPYPALTALVCVIGLIGCFIMPARPRWALLASMMFFSAPYWFVQASARYRTPIMWITLLGCGYVSSFLFGRVIRFGTRARSGNRGDGSAAPV